MTGRSGGPGLALARAAARLVGCRFRLHGRDPATGLDCLGLAGAALAGVGRRAELPTGYALRTGEWPAMARLAAAHGLVPATGPDRPGDLWLTRPGPGQLHLAVLAAEAGHLIEAHAGLGRVVAAPRPADRRPLARWRLPDACRGNE